MSARILVIEDDPVMAAMLKLYLERDGYGVTVAHDGTSGLREASSEEVDLVLLDIMLPGLNGWDVCRRLRERRSLPIIMITALDQEEQKVQGLDLGADDYIAKPFSVNELRARVRARLRRHDRTTADPTVLVFPELTIDPPRRKVLLAGADVELTPKEFELLLTLAREPGRVMTHDELFLRVWNYPAGPDNHTLRTHVLRLRQKLDIGSHTYIQTVWGLGYRFEVDAQ